MAKKHVEEYYLRALNDYTEMKQVLKSFEDMDEEHVQIANANLDKIKESVSVLEANYNRLAYIMFLLNQPTKPKKKNGYFKSEQKRLSSIPAGDRDKAVIEENTEALKILNSYLNG